MERFYISEKGHSFKVVGDGDESPKDAEAEVYVKVPCPRCGSLYEIHWPSNQSFAIVAQ